MIPEQELKQHLETIRQGGYRHTDGIDMRMLTGWMLEHIGSPDGELRDRLVYRTFRKFLERDMIGPSLFRHILETVLDDSHLGFDIENTDGDGVFKRSFSTLLIALLIELGWPRGVLDRPVLERIYARLCAYAVAEQNLTGYCAGKGWAHSVAHLSDAFGALVGTGCLNTAQIMVLLGILTGKFRQGDYYYIDGEDERAGAVIADIIANERIHRELILTWMHSLTVCSMKDEYPNDSIIRGNIRNLTRSVYFLVQPDRTDILHSAREVLLRMSFT